MSDTRQPVPGVYGPGTVAASAEAPTLTLADLERLIERFQKPAAGCILVDVNMPADLCATLPRNETAVRIMYGYGPKGDEAWSIMQRLRADDWAVVVHPSQENLWVRQAAPADAHLATAIFGLPVYHVRSLRSAPWRVMLAASAEEQASPRAVAPWPEAP